ncbi:hypothetical protein FQA39_LY09707 [Lamprigera yunnana]|nr:hypothetical protein FQA39_LY09707 [Lamprigera yunnana]
MWNLKVVLVFFCVKCVWGQYHSYFLPKTIKPIRYNLTIAPNAPGIFYGRVYIDIEVLHDTQNITLHAKDLNINKQSVMVTDVWGKNVRIVNTSEDIEKEFYIIHLENRILKERRYTILIGQYCGPLRDGKSGFFYGEYKNVKGEIKFMALTEFEPTDARKAVPCFDEPHFKATFIVNIIRKGTSMSASNQELLLTRNLGNNFYLDTYKETVSMSTYLLAFAISDFKYTKKNDRIRLLVKPEALEDGSTDYMLSESPKLLKTIETYTGIPYALEKLDLFAAPEEYFLDGAMENWGLIIYNEKYLLCSNFSNSMDIQKCTTYSGHEFAHQWFGNLVTPQSWHYMWLSEGFAAYFQYFITALAEPTWRLDEQYTVEELQPCFRNDIAPYTEPINFIFTEPNSFPSSSIYYYKASAVIRMTEHFLTHNIFVRSLRMYLQKHKFGSTVPDDLFSMYQLSIDISRARHLLGGMNVRDILHSWFTNVGHPIVAVTRDYKTGSITFFQKTFYKNNEMDNNIWPIPITYFLNGFGPRSFTDTTTDYWLTTKSSQINERLTDDWIIVNKHQIGYYRVMYDNTNWNRLITFLRTKDFTVIPPVNRAQLIDDAIFFAQCSKLDFELALNLTTYLIHETDYIPIKSFLANIEELSSSLSSRPEYSIFKNYVKLLLNSAYNKVGLSDTPLDTHIDRLQRMYVAQWMCKFGDLMCQRRGLHLLQLWRQTGVLDVQSDLLFPLLCGAVQISTESDWEFLLQQYYLAKNSIIKSQLINALGCTNQKSIILKFMDILYDVNKNITPKDRSMAIANMMKFSNDGMNIILDYFIDTDMSVNKYDDVFSSSDAIVGLPKGHEHQTAALKSKDRLMDLPILFYTDDALTDGEIYFMNKTSEWLQKYRKTLTIQV